jgi:hypothetical protein
MSDELFGSYQKSRVNSKSVIIGLVALVVLSSAAYFVVWMSKPLPRLEDDIIAEQIRDNTVSMLQYRTFSGDEFRQQILGKGKLERYIQVNDEAFFTYPETEESDFDGFLEKNFFDRAKIEFGKTEGDELRLGDYRIPSYYAGQFFRTKLVNIKIPPKQTLTFPYSSVNYTLSLGEMNDFFRDKSVYGGKLIAQQGERTNRPTFVFANHGIMVAKPDEPSLKRLTDDLLKDVGPDREARIQTLVDFVANEIEYSYTEGYGGRETLKRPDETLMTRNGDCSNKTILLASLLEQIGEEYILLYCLQHITVAVPIGNFPNENKVDLEFNSRQWAVAETTVRGFQVGLSKVDRPEILQLVNYVQDPKHMDVIFDVNSGEFLKFL